MPNEDMTSRGRIAFNTFQTRGDEINFVFVFINAGDIFISYRPHLGES